MFYTFESRTKWSGRKRVASVVSLMTDYLSDIVKFVTLLI